jgi:hypothetical protein
VGCIVFTAKRSLLPGRASGISVGLEVDLLDAVRRRELRKEVHRASAGAQETLYLGADTCWDLEFEPVSGEMYSRLKEFLDSTAGGELFQVSVYGTEVKPITAWRNDSGYSARPLIRTGDRALDGYVMRISVTEA